MSFAKLNFTRILGYVYPVEKLDTNGYMEMLKENPIKYIQEIFPDKESDKKNRFNRGSDDYSIYLEKEVKNVVGFERYVELKRKETGNARGYNYATTQYPNVAMENIISKSFYTLNWKEELEKSTVDYVSIFKNLKKYKRRLNILYENEKVCLVSTNSSYDKSFFVFKKNLELIGRIEKIDLKKYDNLSLGEVKHLLNNGEELSNGKNELQIDSTTYKEQVSIREKAQNEVANMIEELEKIERGESEELLPFKQEIERLKAEMMAKAEEQKALIEVKKREMEIKVSEMNRAIYFMQVDLNSLMYYLGEKLSMAQVKKGKFAPKEQPIVTYQKIRYLDIEMARYVGMNGIQWSEKDQFEDVLAHREDILELFNQSNKSISFFKLSKTGKYTGYSEKVGNLTIPYDVAHGNELGYIVRDGDNVYVGWMNDEDITLKENIFYSTKTTEMTTADSDDELDYFAKRDREEKLKMEQETEQKEMSSRYVILHLLQGLIDGQHEFFRLIERPNVFLAITGEQKSSSQIIFSVSDGWLEYKRFGTYRDVLDKYAPDDKETDSHLIFKKGEKIITTQRVSGSFWKSHNGGRAYNTEADRSRGFDCKDRVHDVSVDDNTIYEINLVDKENWNNIYISLEKMNSKEKFDNDYYGMYYSNKKPLKRIARANIMLKEGEYIRLTFLNTILIEYLLNLKETSNSYWEKSYTYMAEYYRKMLRFLTEREKIEFDLIEKYYEELGNVYEWQMELTNWKLEYGVTGEITDYQAKRFSKYLKNK